MSGLNLAATTKEEQDKVAIDLVASGVVYKERLAMPVVAELDVREQPEHLREYFRARLEYYRQLSAQLPGKNAPEMPEKRMRLKNSAIPDAFCLSLAGFYACRVMFFSGRGVCDFLPAGDNT
ncbi:TPA: hypothetical protein G8N70_004505, partial [Salmonella enterica]|nr:hypothetical protein [Salmonella enterica subsp. enterica serovar Bredeney]EDS6072855.1 hypothetical protein [Salmonella enterica subsp. enterica serovar Pomona]HAF2414114.1 hypothetical protein [Salmonella enterica]